VWLGESDVAKMLTFARKAFEIYWSEDQDMSKDEVVAEICTRAGVDRAALFEAIGRAEIKDQLRANTDEVMRRGGFGSPTMFVGETDMFFGNDRLPLVRAALERAG